MLNSRTGRGVIGIGFTIDNFDSLIDDTGEGHSPRYNVPEKLAYLLRSISVSTSRGVLYSYLKGTYLDKAIIPIIPIEDFEIENLKVKKVKTFTEKK